MAGWGRPQSAGPRLRDGPVDWSLHGSRRALAKENGRLKKIDAEQAPDINILTETLTRAAAGVRLGRPGTVRDDRTSGVSAGSPSSFVFADRRISQLLTWSTRMLRLSSVTLPTGG